MYTLEYLIKNVVLKKYWWRLTKMSWNIYTGAKQITHIKHIGS